MNHFYKNLLLLCFNVIFIYNTHAQNLENILKGGEIHGNFQSDIQFYKEDSLIDAPKVSENILSNSFANVIYSNSNFSCGFRFESYLNALQGFDSRYKGNGVPYKFASYKNNFLDITVGSFYEQFGNGLIFRSYEEKNLGIDNALDGIKIKINPSKGIYFKGIIGQQRFFFERSSSILRGADLELNLNEMYSLLSESKTKITIGGAAISKFQKDEDITLKLPENVAAISSRANISRGNIIIFGEYAYKINDPSAINNYIYKPGQAAFISTSYSVKGFSFSISAKRNDNMSFKSDRSVRGNELSINFLPPLTKQHQYSLAAFYPYATQENGEMGYQSSLTYKFKKNTVLGGRYGTELSLNFARTQAIQLKQINDSTPLFQRASLGYESDFFTFGNQVYFEDFNIELTKKITKKIKLIAMFMNVTYNIAVIEGHPGEEPVYGKIGLVDFTYKHNDNHSIRFEVQHLYTKQDEKNFASALIEYTINPNWFFAFSDVYNYNNPSSNHRIHYFNGSFGYMKDVSRISLSYGKQREGIVCVGGVCRNVPASNGLLLSISTSF